LRIGIRDARAPDPRHMHYARSPPRTPRTPWPGSRPRPSRCSKRSNHRHAWNDAGRFAATTGQRSWPSTGRSA